MLFLVMNLLYWAQIEGGCSQPSVSISEGAGGFKLICEFTCLGPKHIAQLWSQSRNECIVNVTSSIPNMSLLLNISSDTKVHAGKYYCMTQPPEAISPHVWIPKADNKTTSTLTTPSTPWCDSTQQRSIAAGLQGQIWYWTLLGKTLIFILFSLASLAVKYKRG